MTKALREWLSRLWATVRPNRQDADLEAELRLHLELEAEAEERRSGAQAGDARRTASLRVGQVTQTMDAVRDQRGLPWLETILHDVRYAVRLMVRQPRFSLLIMLTIALAIGASTALFSVVDATVIRPLSYPHAEELMDGRVGSNVPELNRVIYSVAISDMRRWRGTPAVTAAAALSNAVRDVVIDGLSPRRVSAREVTEGYLGVYGVVPDLGRDFTAGDTIESAPPVIIVSHAFWQTSLGADPSAIGRTIRYDNVAAQLVGVAPPGFDGAATVWRPMHVNNLLVDRRSVAVVLRLRPHVAVEAAARQLSTVTPIGDWRSASSGDGSLGAPVRLTPVLDGIVARSASVVPVLVGAVGLIVLIACVNVAGLLLARGATREAELSVRASLGAGRPRLFRQLLVESLTLAAAGGAAGTALAWLGLDALMAILPVKLEPGTVASINPRVLIATVLLTMVTGIAFGVAPALRLSRASVTGALARGARSQRPALSRRGGQILIVTEVTLAVMLIACAGLMVRSFTRLLSVDLGFDPQAVVAFNAVPVESAPTIQRQYFSEVLQTIRALPDVEAAGAVDFFALGDTSTVTTVTANGKDTGMGIRQVLPGYFEALGLRLRQGSLPVTADADAGRPVAVLNESGARVLFPGGAVGEQLTFNGRLFTVIGVVSDFHMRGPSGEVSPEAFLPFVPIETRNRLALGLTLVVRPRPGATGLFERLRHIAEQSSRRAVVDDARPGTAWFDDRVATPRHQTWLIGLLGLLGLALTLVGVFRTTAYAVARRTREIGVRLALGAQPRDVVGHMVADAGWPMLLGLAGGLGGAYFATRLLASWLFNTAPRDPATFAAISALTIACTLIASWIPARRAARVDPVTALRAE